MEEYSLSAELWEMNDEVAFISDQCRYWHFRTRRALMRTELVNDMYAHRVTYITKNDKQVEESVAANWCKWPLRREHPSIEYAPGEPEILDNGNLNVWRGWGMEPRKSVAFMKVWHRFMDYFFQSDPQLRTWVEQWMAYPIQHPGAKLYTCVLFHSVMTGTGKTWLGYFLGKIYGVNYKEIKQEDLHSDYNAWAKEKQFVLGDEITSSDKRREKDHLNHLITRERITVNIKYQPHYEINDCINYMFTSQHPDAIFLDPHDRRVCVHHAPEQKVPESIRAPLDELYKSGEGPAALMHYLLHEVDVSRFNPAAEPPLSAAKESMITLTASDLDNFAHMLKADPSSVLRYDGVAIDRSHFTSAELVGLYDPEDKFRTSRTAMSRALSRAGFEQFIVLTKTGSRRLWVVRDIERWRNARHTDRVADYDSSVVYLSEAKRRKYAKKEDKS